ncbi:MAG: hypothetical protein LR005_00095 [Candidatus Pacebacteria bacterium]|nr:hypothetical protein [Candidatus Paceibacterota bacterium]
MEGLPKKQNTQEEIKKIDWKDLSREYKYMLILDISEDESSEKLVEVLAYFKEKMDNLPPAFDSITFIK